MSPLRGLLLAAALALLPSVTSPAETLTIHVILPLTGANTFIGQGMKKGYEALRCR